MKLEMKQFELIKALGDLNFTNPFLEERVKLEKVILGSDFSYAGEVWHAHEDKQHAEKNLAKIITLAEFHANDIREKIINGLKLNKKIIQAYENLVIYHLFEKYRQKFTDFLGKNIKKR